MGPSWNNHTRQEAPAVLAEIDNDKKYITILFY